MKIRLEHIIQLFKSAYRRATVFFRNYRSRNVLTFLFFLLLSFSFWVLLSMQEEYEIQVAIPVIYKNVPPDIAFVQPPPSEITARVRDKGTVLLNYTAGGKMSVLEIDMEQSSDQSGVLSYSGKEIESAIMKRLVSTTNLLNINPPQIEAPYSKLVNRKLPVEFSGDIQTEPGFQLSGEIIIDPPVVDVYAGDVVLDTLKTIHTVFTEIRKAKKTIEEKIELSSSKGVTIEPKEVLVIIPIEEYTEKTLEVPVHVKGVPKHFMIRMFPAKVNVVCNVPLSRFKDISEEDFIVEASVDDHEQNVLGMISVTLVKKPDWIDDVTVSPTMIEFLLEQNVSDE